MTYYIISGEASGDLHGSNLAKELLRMDSDAHLCGIGGDKMQAAGVDLFFHYESISYMGVLEVVKNLPVILERMKATKAHIAATRPNVLVLIDFSGFNLKIAKYAKSIGIKVAYYISPKFWAWNESRVEKVKKYVDEMYCILPFEPDFYAKHHYHTAYYIGNPLMDEISAFNQESDFLQKNKLPTDKKIIALLPGSRKQEVSKIFPAMAKVAAQNSDYEFIVAVAPNFSEENFTPHITSKNVHLIYSNTYNLLKVSSAAIVTSGTATLETALFHCPQVVVYITSNVTAFLVRLVIKLKYISLVNLVASKGVVREFIQADCTAENINTELYKLLNDNIYRNNILQEYKEITEKVGEAGASTKTAKHIIALAKK